ncbi:hypothetical protein Esti_004692 [Eimeria stiedai]
MAKEERQGCLLQGPHPSPPAPLLGSEDSLALIQSSIERTTRKLEWEKRRLYDLSDALEKAQAEYDEKRTRYSYNKSDAMQELAKAEKHLRLLENRVAQATSKHNVVTSAIAKLRSSIDKHRKDRLSLDQLNRDLTREIQLKEFELKTLQAEMASQVDAEQQTLCRKGRIYEVREKEREEFRKLTTEKEQILRDHERELKTLQVKSDKGQEHLRAQIRCNDFAMSAEDRLVDPETLMKHILKTTLLNTMQRYAIRQHKKQVEVFERAMDSINASTGISDAGEVVRIFTLLEERNFSAITYVNTINQEIKDMENRKKAITERIQEHLELGGKAEKITQELLNEVKDQIQSITHQMEVRKERILAQTRALEKVKLHVSDCVTLIEREGSDFQPPRELAIKEAGTGASLIEMLQYVESFVISKANQLRQSGSLPCLTSSAKGGEGGGPQEGAPEDQVHMKEIIKVPSFSFLAAEPRRSTKHRGTASVKPSAHADSGSDDYEVCERPLTDMELRMRTAQSFMRRRRRDQRGSKKRSLLSDSSRPDTPESRSPEGGDGLLAEAAGEGACSGAEARRRLTHLVRDHSPRDSITEGVLSLPSLQLPVHQTRTRSKTAACAWRPHTKKQQQGLPTRNNLQASPRFVVAGADAQAASAATEATTHALSQSTVPSADASAEADRLEPPAISAADPAEEALFLAQQQEDIPFAGARQLSLEEAAAPTKAQPRGRALKDAHVQDESPELPDIFRLNASSSSKTGEEEASPPPPDEEEGPLTRSDAAGPPPEQTAERLVQAALQQQEGERQALAGRGASREAASGSLDRVEDPIPASGLSSTDAREACEGEDVPPPPLEAAQDPEGEGTGSAVFSAEVEKAAGAEAPSKALSLAQASSENADARSPKQSDGINSPVVDVVSDGGESQQPAACEGDCPEELEVSSTVGRGRAASPTQAAGGLQVGALFRECSHLNPACSEEKETGMVRPAIDSLEGGREGGDMNDLETVEAPPTPAAAAAALAAAALAATSDAPVDAEGSPQSYLMDERSPADPREPGSFSPEDEGAASRRLMETKETPGALQAPQGLGQPRNLKGSPRHPRGSTGPLRRKVSFCNGVLLGQAPIYSRLLHESTVKKVAAAQLLLLLLFLLGQAERQETASRAWICAMAEEHQGQAEGEGPLARFVEETAHEEAELGEAVSAAAPQPNSETEEAQAQSEETLNSCSSLRAPESSSLDTAHPSSPPPPDQPPETPEDSAAHGSSVSLGKGDALLQPGLETEPGAPASNPQVEEECDSFGITEGGQREELRGSLCSSSHVFDVEDLGETRRLQREEEVPPQQLPKDSTASAAATAAAGAATSAAAARSSSLVGQGSLTVAAVAAAAAAPCGGASVLGSPAASARGDQHPQPKTETEEERASHAQEGDASAEADEGRKLRGADAQEQLEGPPALETSSCFSSCFDSHNPTACSDRDDKQQSVAKGLVEPQAAEAPAAAAHAAAEAVAAVPPSTPEEAAGGRPQHFSTSTPRSSTWRRPSSANRGGDEDKRVLSFSNPDEAVSAERPEASCPQEEHHPEERPLEEGRQTQRCSLLGGEEGLTILASRVGHALAFAGTDESPLEGGEGTDEEEASLGEAAPFDQPENAGRVQALGEEGTVVVSADAAEAAEGKAAQPSAQQQEEAAPEGGRAETEAGETEAARVELRSCEAADKPSPQHSDIEATVDEGVLVRRDTPTHEESDRVAALPGAASA